MRPTLWQKRLLLALVEPPLGLLYRLWRRLSGGATPPGDGAQSPRKILVVRLDTIGDVLLSEPAIGALKERFPQAQLHLVASPQGISLLSGNPAIDVCISYEGPWHRAWRGKKVNWLAELGQMGRVWRRLRAEGYDLALELRGDFRDILFAALAGAKRLIGSSCRGGARLLDVDAPVDAAAHRVDFALGIVAAAGASPFPRPPRLHLSPGDRAVAEGYLPSRNGVQRIGLHLGAGFPSKCLPLPTFSQVMGQLHMLRPGGGVEFVILGGSEDTPLAEGLRRLLPFPVTDLVGKLSLKETAAILERCALFIGNDSAPMHLAAAVGTPLVAFFGPSEPQKYHPYGAPYRVVEIDLTCRPCDHVHCVHREYLCMTLIVAQDVLRAVTQLLDQLPWTGPEPGSPGDAAGSPGVPVAEATSS